MTESAITLKHVDLKSAFDRSFQEAPLERDHELTHLLIVRIGTASFALKVGDLAGLARMQKVVPIPSTDRRLARPRWPERPDGRGLQSCRRDRQSGA